MSIRTKNILISSFGLILLGIISIATLVFSLKTQAKREVKIIEENLTREKEQKLNEITQAASSIIENAYLDAHSDEKVIALYQQDLKNIVNIAMDGIKSIDRDPSLSRSAKKKLAQDFIKNLRYNENDYIWINDSNPTMIMHPMKPALDGQDLSEFADPNGKKLFVEFVSVCEAEGEGFVNYMWPKPGEDEPVQKISFVKRYDAWDWILGTGVYLESSEKALMDKAKEAIGTLRYGPDNKDYFWIQNLDNQMVMHPFKPQLNGTSLAEFKDQNGKFLFTEMVEVCKKDGQGFVNYMWPKPGSEDPIPKLSFVKLVPQTSWIIGTGIYLDDISKIIAEQENLVSGAISKQIKIQVVVLVLLICVMLVVFSYFSVKITRPILNASHMLGEIATGEGDLTSRMEVKSKDEIGALAGNFNLFVEKLQSIISLVANNAIEVNKSAGELESLSGELSRNSKSSSQSAENMARSSEAVNVNMNSVASAMEETSVNLQVVATATEEMSATVNEIVGSTETARVITEGAVTQTTVMLDKIGTLHQTTARISEFVDMISEISAQVNLLALNATIEAARAGDAGKGFAVVAMEIKELAKQTNDASNLIKENVIQIQASSEGTTVEIRKISDVVNQINDIITSIAAALEEQSVATSEITTNISQASDGLGEINMSVSQTAGLVEQVNQDAGEVNTNSQKIHSQSGEVQGTSVQLRKFSDELENLVSKFKL